MKWKKGLDKILREVMMKGGIAERKTDVDGMGEIGKKIGKMEISIKTILLILV